MTTRVVCLVSCVYLGAYMTVCIRVMCTYMYELRSSVRVTCMYMYVVSVSVHVYMCIIRLNIPTNAYVSMLLCIKYLCVCVVCM